MPQIPRDSWPESTIALLRNPYHFIADRCRRYQADLFEARILLQPTICLMGKEAAELFYDPARFIRAGAAPEAVQSTLLGQGGVQGLDGEAHRLRKRMFMSLMTAERITSLVNITTTTWRTYAQQWMTRGHVVLYDQLQEILCRAVCEWAGVPLAEADVGQRTQELTALFDQAGAKGLGHIWSRMARNKAEQWMSAIITDVRAHRLTPPPDSAAAVIATHRGEHEELLDAHTAAVELLNVLRPVIAVSVYLTLVAVALHAYPRCRQQVEAGVPGYTKLFVQEVRRFFPFFPMVFARVRSDFDWRGYHFPQGRRVLLDIHGTNHDERVWESPEQFRPERFQHWDGNPFNFIPQGGGDYFAHHRCAGEWITLALMEMAVDFLTQHMHYDVPAQDLRINERRMPALPRSRFIISNVRVG